MLLFSALLIAVLFVLLIILGTGIGAFVVNSSTAATVCEVISRTTFATAVLALMLIVVPRSREVFTGFGVELPAITILVLNCTNWNLWQFLLISLLLVFCIAADGAIFGTFCAKPGSRRTTQRYSFLITLCLTAILFLIITALYVPMIRLVTDLS